MFYCGISDGMEDLSILDEFGICILIAILLWVLCSGVGADAEGWKYRKMSIGDSELDMGAGPKSEAGAGLKSSDGNVKQAASVTGGWSADCSPNCVQRRRRWIRHWCRWPCQPMLASPAMSEKQLLSESKEVEVSLKSLKLLDLSLDGGEEEAQKCEGMVLIASLLCACLRNVKLPQARRGALCSSPDSLQCAIHGAGLPTQ